MFVRREHCRSPVANGAFEDVARREGLADVVRVDSVGTHGYYNAGEPPDPRARESALDISNQRACLLDPDACRRFDYFLAMDERLCKGGAEIRTFLDYAPGPETEVPDPYYYAGSDGFQKALDLIEASEGLLHEIRERHPGG